MKVLLKLVCNDDMRIYENVLAVTQSAQSIVIITPNNGVTEFKTCYLASMLVLDD